VNILLHYKAAGQAIPAQK